VPSGPVSASAQQQAQRTALAAANQLEAGHQDLARTELQRALVTDPNNKLALNLMRQITADPVTTLGRESFGYVVRSNDTMSGIAGRFLGDIYAFYILARYNDIAVPRQVAAGQTLRIPGKAPSPEAIEREARRAEAAAAARIEPKKEVAAIAPAVPPAPAPVVAPPAPPEPTPGELAMRSAEAAERDGNLDRALAEYRRAATLEQPAAVAKADQLRKQLVLRHTLSAHTAFAKQDLDGAIHSWDRVLQIDPGNPTAQFERQRAQALKEKVKKL
jgi:tetratricopeptide (TPR) repeat protein